MTQGTHRAAQSSMPDSRALFIAINRCARQRRRLLVTAWRKEARLNRRSGKE